MRARINIFCNGNDAFALNNLLNGMKWVQERTPTDAHIAEGIPRERSFLLPEREQMISFFKSMSGPKQLGTSKVAQHFE